MESLNRTLKNTLDYIVTVQNACDQNRLHIEKQNSEEYNKFVKEWMQDQIRAAKERHSPKKDSSINKSILNKQEQEKSVPITDEIEELAMIDNLLEKARNIRMKNKVPLKKVEITKTEDKTGPTEKRVLKIVTGKTSILSNNISKSHNAQTTKTLSHVTLETGFIGKTVPRSKSAGSTFRLKATNMPRSRSANVNHPSKHEQSVKNGPTSPTYSENGSGLLSSSRKQHGKIETQHLSIVSNKELDEFKNISSGQSMFKRKVGEKIQEKNHCDSNSTSDFSQDSLHHNHFPTYKTYQEKFKQISSSKSFFKLSRSQLWYPFLNSKNQKYLIHGSECQSLCNFTKAIKLIHKIQETMFWIDLLSLLGKDTLPKIMVLDENDWNVIRFYSYIESIYYENLQRFPILDTT